MTRNNRFACALIAVVTVALSVGSAIAAPILDQTGNGLANGSFESGNTNAVTGNGGIGSAASGWGQWENSGNGAPTSELITDAEMMPGFGLGVVDGNHALHVTTLGASDGLFTFPFYGHPGWSLYDAVTFSGWVYVISGSMQFSVGSNQNGFSSTVVSASDSWQFVSVTSAAGQRNDEPLLYSNGGPTEFIVDSVWLNNGTASNHPLQSMGTQVPEPPVLGLVMSGLGLIALSRRRRTTSR